MDIQRDIFPLRGGESQAKPQWALPVIDQTSAQYTSSTFTAGTNFTIPSGAANSAVKIQLPFLPILGNFGKTGSFGNSSLVLGGALATTLTTEVAFIADTANLGGNITSLTGGQYMVDYETGIIYGKRVDTGTTGTVTYSYLAKGSVSGSGASANQVQGTAASGTTAVGNPVLEGGIANSTSPTFTAGQVAAFQTDLNGNEKVVEQFAPQYENNTLKIAQTGIAGTYTHITTATTTLVKSGQGVLNVITINKAVAAGTITIYDNTAASGTVIGIITYGATLVTDPPDFAPYSVLFLTGCTIVTSGAFDITVSTT